MNPGSAPRSCDTWVRTAKKPQRKLCEGDIKGKLPFFSEPPFLTQGWNSIVKPKQQSVPCVWSLDVLGCWGGFSAMGSKAVPVQAVLVAAGKAGPALGLTRLPRRLGKGSADFRNSHWGKIQPSRRRRWGESRGTDMAARSLCGLQSEGEARGGIQFTDLFPGKISHDFTASSANMKTRSGPMWGSTTTSPMQSHTLHSGRVCELHAKPTTKLILKRF